jgi:hypothetical protein
VGGTTNAPAEPAPENAAAGDSAAASSTDRRVVDPPTSAVGGYTRDYGSRGEMVQPGTKLVPSQRQVCVSGPCPERTPRATA